MSASLIELLGGGKSEYLKLKTYFHPANI